MSSTKHRGPKPALPTKQARSFGVMWWLVPLAIVVSLFGLYGIFNNASTSKNSPSARGYDVGTPGVGAAAPAFSLTDNVGRQMALKDYRGKNVLLFFQEGLACQPCWEQIADLERDPQRLKAAGVDALVSITTDPADLIARKLKDMGLTTPVASDPDTAVSRKYGATQFVMAGHNSSDGHSFILVGPDGIIRWRADYGGPPNYTMYVPLDRLFGDLRAALKL